MSNKTYKNTYSVRISAYKKHFSVTYGNFSIGFYDLIKANLTKNHLKSLKSHEIFSISLGSFEYC